MKALLIGGTGRISSEVTRQLANAGHDVWILNRGKKTSTLPENVHTIVCDINDEQKAETLLETMTFDVVCNFIGFVPAHVERDFKLFSKRTKQYIFISSASAYHKPMKDYMITEGTSLANPYWDYSRDKIACEDFLMKMYRETGFPVTIVRPSHTYDEKSVPLGVHGNGGNWQILKRMLEGKPVIIHGDGTTLWTVTHSSDFARAFIGLMGNPHAIGEAFQITSDESVTWNQIYNIVADTLGVELKPYHVASEFLASVSNYDLTGPLLGDKANTVVFDNSKLKRTVPGFQANIRAEEGIRQAVQYMLSHPESQMEDKEFDIWCDKVIAVLEQAKKEFNT